MRLYAVIFGGFSGDIFSPSLIVVLNCSPFQILGYFGLAFHAWWLCNASQGDRRWRGGCVPSRGAHSAHTRHSPAIYCWRSLFLWRSFSSLLASQEGCVTSQHPASSLESPGRSLGLTSAGWMHYQQVFELKGTLFPQLPLELSAACSQGFKCVVRISILFNKMCIAY